jgi:hypothetical protein
MDLSVLFPSLPSALLGGVVAAFINYLLTRKKMDTEIRRNELEIQRLEAHLSATMTYVLPTLGETVVYPLRGGIQRADFRGEGGSRFNSRSGRGELSLDNSTLRIHRTNTDGRYVVELLRYVYQGQEMSALPKNEQLLGGRKLRLQCDVRVVGGEHTLDFALREDTAEERWLAHHRERITRDEWIPINAFFRVPSHMGCCFLIEDRSVSKANSSVHIRNLILAEREQ